MKNTHLYTQLTLSERVEMYTLYKQGISLQEIARRIRRNVGTMSRELKRNRSRYTKQYNPVKAQEISSKRQLLQRTKAPLKNVEIFLYVREKLRDGWSPESIAGRLSLDHPGLSICQEAIYQYIYGKGKRYKLWKYLTKSHKKRRVKSGRRVQKEKGSSRIPGAVSIDLRPKRVLNRKQIGHFETDLMEGRRETKTALSVTVERKTRYTLLHKVSSKQAEPKEKVLTDQIKTLQSLEKATKPIVRSITADNGNENAHHTKINVPFYFCHPYHSWEKGTVENTIGRIRRYVPKGANIYNLTDIQIQWLENMLNNTPRKCLGFKTPNEVMEQETNRYKFRRYQQLKETSVALQVRM